jgi:hypothetical protein
MAVMEEFVSRSLGITNLLATPNISKKQTNNAFGSKLAVDIDQSGLAVELPRIIWSCTVTYQCR